jgi:hypothetical protein
VMQQSTVALGEGGGVPDDVDNGDVFGKGARDCIDG